MKTRLIRSFLLLLLAAASIATAETIVTDYWGNVLFRLPWPTDETLYVKTPLNATMPALAPSRATPVPSTPPPKWATPAPATGTGSGTDDNRYYGN